MYLFVSQPFIHFFFLNAGSKVDICFALFEFVVLLLWETMNMVNPQRGPHGHNFIQVMDSWYFEANIHGLAIRAKRMNKCKNEKNKQKGYADKEHRNEKVSSYISGRY